MLTISWDRCPVGHANNVLRFITGNKIIYFKTLINEGKFFIKISLIFIKMQSITGTTHSPSYYRIVSDGFGCQASASK